MFKLASPLFGSRPTDTLIPVDPARIQDNLPRNSLTDTAREAAQGAARAIKATDQILNDASTIISETARTGDPRGLQRVSEVLAGGGGAFSQLDYRLQQAVLDRVGDGGQEAIAVIDGISSRCGFDVSGVRDLFNLLGDWANQADMFRLIDVAAESALLSVIVDAAMRLCNPGVLNVVRDNASEPEVWQNVYATSSLSAAQNSRLGALEIIVDGIGANAVRAKYPDIVNQTLSHYVIPDNSLPQDYPVLADRLTHTASLLDPNWNQGGTNLSAYKAMSADARSVLLQDPAHRDQVLMADMFPVQPLDALLPERYPNVAWG